MTSPSEWLKQKYQIGIDTPLSTIAGGAAMPYDILNAGTSDPVAADLLTKLQRSAQPSGLSSLEKKIKGPADWLTEKMGDQDDKSLAAQTEDTLRSIGNYQTRITAAGQPLPEPESALSTLFKVLEFIDRPRDAIVSGIHNVQRGRGFGKGFVKGLTGEQNTDFSDILREADVLRDNKIARGVAGFAGDVLSDPLSWTTLGAGSFAKGLLTGTGKTVSRESAEQAIRSGSPEFLSRLFKSAGVADEQIPAAIDDAARFLSNRGERTLSNLSLEGAENLIRTGDAKAVDLLRTTLKKATEAHPSLGTVQLPDLYHPQILDQVVNQLKDSALGRDVLGKVTGKLQQAAPQADIMEYLTTNLAKRKTIENGAETVADSGVVDKAVSDVIDYFRQGAKGVNVGLPFTAGKELVPGYKMQDVGAKVGQAVGNTLKNIPGVGPVFESTYDGIKKVFSPSWMEDVDASVRKLAHRWSQERKGALTAGNLEVMRNVLETFKGATDEEMEYVRKAVEATDDFAKLPKELRDELDAMVDADDEEVLNNVKRLFDVVKKDIHRWAGEEFDVGALDHMLRNYIPHVTNWELRGDKFVWGGGKTKRFSVQNFHNWKREHQGTIDAVNEALAQRYGVPDFIETNLVRIMVDRGLRHNAVIQDRAFVDKILYGLGRKVNANTPDLLDSEQLVINKGSIRYFLLDRIGEMEIRRNTKALAPGTEDLVKTADGAAFINTGIDPASAEKVTASLSKQDAGFAVVGQEIDNRINSILNRFSKKNSDALLTLTPQEFELLNKEITEAMTQLKGSVAVGLRPIDVEAWALPKGVVDYVNRSSSLQMDEGSKTLAGVIDKLYKIWKPTVTGMNAGYHVRNYFGGKWQNFLDLGFNAFNPKYEMIAKQLVNAARKGATTGGTVIEVGGKSYTAKELINMMERNNVWNTFMATDTASLREQVERGIKEGLDPKEEIKKLLPWRTGRTVGNLVEKDSRSINFIANLDNGLDEKQAAEMAIKHHFDYSELTDVERNLFKRVFPFYTFFRKNLPLQLEAIANEPGKFLSLYHAQQNMENTTGVSIEDMPEWLQEQTPIPLGSIDIPFLDRSNDRGAVFTPSLPLEDVGRVASPLKTLVNMMTPFAKVPLEIYNNQSMLNGAPISQYPGQKTPMLGLGPDIPVQLQYILSQLSQARNLSNVANPRDITDASVVAPMKSTGNTPTDFLQNVFIPNVVKSYSPDAAKLRRLYQYNRDLANVIQKLKDSGTDIDTITELAKQKRIKRDAGI